MTVILNFRDVNNQYQIKQRNARRIEISIIWFVHKHEIWDATWRREKEDLGTVEKSICILVQSLVGNWKPTNLGGRR